VTDADRENFRRRLLALGYRLTSDFAAVAGEALREAGGEPSGNLSNVPVHPADLGSDNYEEEVSLRLLENEDRVLEEVVAALRRMEQGTYGRCERCHREIGRERLRAVPYARYCIDDARAAEGERP
jgi:RNA polymerase-binding transcription factor DksA